MNFFSQVVILKGTVGQEPEVKSLPSGTSVCNFSIATNEKIKNKEGELIETTEWSNIEAWGKLGENCNKLQKGDLVVVIGTKSTRGWEDKEGNKRTTTNIKATEVAVSVFNTRSRGTDTQNTSNQPMEEDDLPF